MTVPFCGNCQSVQRRHKLLTVMFGAVLAAALGVAAALTFPFTMDDGSAVFLYRLVIVVVSALVGASLGLARTTRREPVRLRNYSERAGTVQAWFENPDFRTSVEALNIEGSSRESES